jgi:AcrR family transcriptional regulator
VLTTRDRIVDATAALFMQQGYSASGLKQISLASEAPVGSLYHHFPGGKAELAAETLRRSGRAYGELVGAVLDGVEDIVEAMKVCFAAAGETLRESGYADACPIATVALEVASSDEALRQVTDEIFAEWLAGLRDRFRRAGIGDAAAADLATTFLACLEGGFLLSRAAQDTAAMQALGRSMVALVEAAVTP